MNRRMFLQMLGLIAGTTIYQTITRPAHFISWLVGIGDSNTVGVYGAVSYAVIIATMLNRWYGNFAIAGSRTPQLLEQSIKAVRRMKNSRYRTSGIVVCTSGINDLRYCKPDQFDDTLASVLTNLQNTVNYWAEQLPGTLVFILPPVENGSGVQGMSRLVTDAYLSNLVYPCVPLDWYPTDGLHDLGQAETYWHDAVHPNTKGHEAMAQAVLEYLNGSCLQ